MLRALSSLLVLAAASAARPHGGGGAVVRERLVALSAGELRALLAAERPLSFTPFPGTTLVLEPAAVRPGALAELVVRARMAGDAGGRARLVLNGEALVAEVVSPLHGVFRVHPAPGGAHVVQEVERERESICAGVLSPDDPPIGAPPAAGAGAELRSLAPAPVQVGPTIDVLVVYTPSARALSGGRAALEAVIDSHIDYTNQVYEDSGVHQRLRLVHAQEVAYVESGNSITDLQRLKQTSDGFLDAVHALRDAFGADCVVLIATSGSAGVGYQMGPPAPSFASCAFSTIGHAVSGLTFAHELGHNMGSGHDNGAPGTPPSFCFSHGHRTPNGAWRTIMSGPPGTFVDRFSSPALAVAGFPLGVSGAACPPDAADNVRSLNATAATVAAFRPTVVP